MVALAGTMVDFRMVRDGVVKWGRKGTLRSGTGVEAEEEEEEEEEKEEDEEDEEELVEERSFVYRSTVHRVRLHCSGNRAFHSTQMVRIN